MPPWNMSALFAHDRIHNAEREWRLVGSREKCECDQLSLATALLAQECAPNSKQNSIHVYFLLSIIPFIHSPC